MLTWVILLAFDFLQEFFYLGDLILGQNFLIKIASASDILPEVFFVDCVLVTRRVFSRVSFSHKNIYLEDSVEVLFVLLVVIRVLMLVTAHYFQIIIAFFRRPFYPLNYQILQTLDVQTGCQHKFFTPIKYL